MYRFNPFEASPTFQTHEVPSLLKPLFTLTSCQLCVKLSPSAHTQPSDQPFCTCFAPEPLTTVVYWHNVPTLNGYELTQDHCLACMLRKRPQQSYNEMHLCERELGLFRKEQVRVTKRESPEDNCTEY